MPRKFSNFLRLCCSLYLILGPCSGQLFGVHHLTKNTSGFQKAFNQPLRLLLTLCQDTSDTLSIFPISFASYLFFLTEWLSLHAV